MPDEKEEVYYWNPNMHWKRIGEKKIQIGKYIFSGIVERMFPEVYFRFNEGQTYSDFCTLNEKIPEETKRKMFESFISNGIITNTLCSIREIFEVQYKPMGDQNIIRDNCEAVRVQIAQVERAKQSAFEKEKDNQIIALLNNNYEQSILFKRRSVRKYNTKKQIPFSIFSELLSVLRIEMIQGMNYSTYPSAGGLFPTDVYLYVKSNRIENVPEGFYYYNPYEHRLSYISNDSFSGKEIHFDSNSEVFETSAFSVYLYYDGNVSGLKYKGRAYFYGILEAGMILQNLALQGTKLGIGSCVIGIIEENEVSKRLNLSRNNMYLIEMEMGLNYEGFPL